MKLFTCCLLLLFFTGFSACENHMDINDVVDGTPSNADTVLAHKFPPYTKIDSSKAGNLAPEFRNK